MVRSSLGRASAAKGHAYTGVAPATGTVTVVVPWKKMRE